MNTIERHRITGGFDFDGGYAIVVNDEYKFNVIDMSGKLMFGIWYDKINRLYDEREVYIIAKKVGKDKYLFNVFRNGRLISEKWFAQILSDGVDKTGRNWLYPVEIEGGKWTVVDENGVQLLGGKTFDYVGAITQGVVDVRNGFDKDGHPVYQVYSVKDGKQIGPDYSMLTDFNEDRIAMVSSRKGKYNWIRTDGSLISRKWYGIGSLQFEEGFAVVRDPEHNNEFNYIDMNGKLLSDRWFYHAASFSNGFGMVRLSKEGYTFNYIDKKGELMF